MLEQILYARLHARHLNILSHLLSIIPIQNRVCFLYIRNISVSSDGNQILVMYAKRRIYWKDSGMSNGIAQLSEKQEPRDHENYHDPLFFSSLHALLHYVPTP